MHKSILYTLLIIITFSCVPSKIFGYEISWEVENRFRLIKGADKEKIYKEALGKITDQNNHGFAKYPSPLSPQEGLINTYWDQNKGSYDTSYLSNMNRVVILKAIPVALVSDSICKWKIIKFGHNEPTNITQSCNKDVRLENVEASYNNSDGNTNNKPWEVGLTIVSQNKHETTVPITIVKPVDMLIVAFGDSYGAGVGVSDITPWDEKLSSDSFMQAEYVKSHPPQWHDSTCQRSMFSGFNQAVSKLTDKNTHQSVTLLDFSCSGARIGLTEKMEESSLEGGGGILTPQKLDDGKIRPGQLDAAAEALCSKGNDSASCQNQRKPDVLIVSIGGNDIHFAEIIKNMMDNHSCYEGCADISNPILTSNGTQMSLLWKMYDKMNDAIEKKIKPNHILVTTYPDPTHDEKGKFCNIGLADRAKWINRILFMNSYTITEQEHSFAYDHVLSNLDNTIKCWVENHSPLWKTVDMIKATATKGICSSRSNFTWIYAAATKSGSLYKGTYHPNIFGYLRYQEKITPMLEDIANSLN